MMKHIITIMLFATLFAACSKEETMRKEDFNKDWLFALNINEDASSTNFIDKDWRSLNLPHDWSVEFPFDTVNLEGCTAYLPGGIGWYRKHFKTKVSNDEKVYILFDGVYNRSEVWLNGHKLGFHPNGYTPFYYDLTPYLKKGEEDNVIAVKVDHSRYADSRWYTGSGIYRNVELITVNKLHIPIWGTFVTTPQVSSEKANVHIEVALKNAYANDITCNVITDIYDQNKNKIKSLDTQEVKIKANSTKKIAQEGLVANPKLWDVEDPNLYYAQTRVILDGKQVGNVETRFGIRTFEFDADKGFFLNGENMKIKGVCLHHDGGLVGAAVPDDVWRRRLSILKDAGCNAIRMSHNPSSDALLDICDEMGFLVQDEFFDEWDYPKDMRLNTAQTISTDYITESYASFFQEWAEKDLKATVLAHRNHPSIFQWSIGNEIEWTYPRNKIATGFWDADWSGNYFWNPTPLSPKEIKERYDSLPKKEHNIGETAHKLAKWTKELDTSRAVVANCILPSASYVSGYADALDVIGYSYRRVMYDYGKEYFPKKPLMGTENLVQWHEWKAIMERPFVSGTFLWTGIDYMGEAHHREGAERRRGIDCGLIDHAGFKKPSFYMMRSLWNDKDQTIYMSTQRLDKSIYKYSENKGVIEKEEGAWKQALWVWHDVNDYWDYNNQDSVVVEVISSCLEVELFLNGNSLGKKNLDAFPDKIYKWLVPYHDGELKAVGISGGLEVSTVLQTPSDKYKLKLEPDKNIIDADGYSVTHITALLVDENEVPVRNKNLDIEFDIQGDMKLLGVDNGDNFKFPHFNTTEVEMSNGQALLILQSTLSKGEATVSAKSGQLSSNTVSIEVK